VFRVNDAVLYCGPDAGKDELFEFWDIYNLVSG
jgi:hypothetical protein